MDYVSYSHFGFHTLCSTVHSEQIAVQVNKSIYLLFLCYSRKPGESAILVNVAIRCAFKTSDLHWKLVDVAKHEFRTIGSLRVIFRIEANERFLLFPVAVTYTSLYISVYRVVDWISVDQINFYQIKNSSRLACSADWSAGYHGGAESAAGNSMPSRSSLWGFLA